ncbi:hypothetical protein ACFLZ3_04320 [Candidatus Omnitrophota bacterium]
MSVTLIIDRLSGSIGAKLKASVTSFAMIKPRIIPKTVLDKPLTEILPIPISMAMIATAAIRPITIPMIPEPLGTAV